MIKEKAQRNRVEKEEVLSNVWICDLANDEYLHSYTPAYAPKLTMGSKQNETKSPKKIPWQYTKEQTDKKIEWNSFKFIVLVQPFLRIGIVLCVFFLGSLSFFLFPGGAILPASP